MPSKNEEINTLRKGGLGCLYHVTDRSNLESIIVNGGLSSWADMKAKDIKPTASGGDAVSRRNDRKAGLDGYVHLYLCEPQPRMLERYRESGMMPDPYVLRISPEAVLAGTPFFSLSNARDENDRYATFWDMKDACGDELPATAEAHVRNIIPYRFIENIPKSHTSRVSSLHPTAVVFVLDHSESMSRCAEIKGRRFDYMSEALALTVNGQIAKLMEASREQGQVSDHIDVAAIGYGTSAYSAWSGPLEGRGFVKMRELESACGSADGGEFPWIEPRDDGQASRADEAMKMTYEMLKAWMEEQSSRYYYPPVVVHITDGDVPGEHRREFLRYAERLKSLSTADGPVLVWNINITRLQQSELVLPSADRIDALVHSSLTLYEASSVLPEIFSARVAEITGEDNDLPHRALGVNVSMDTMSELLDMSMHLPTDGSQA